jgi:hypothetical protein
MIHIGQGLYMYEAGVGTNRCTALEAAYRRQ